MDKKVIIGIAAAGVAGIAAGAAVTIAIKKNFGKIFSEMQDDVSEQIFTSPDGNNTAKVLYGASSTAMGMALISVTATSQNDTCTLLDLARKSNNLLVGQWIDNDHFQLLIGSGRKKQVYDICFEGDKIVANYSLRNSTT